MKPLEWQMIHPRMTVDHLGYIPEFIDQDDESTAAQQFQANYVGGWHPFGAGRWILGENNSLACPDDPTMQPLATAKLRDETICFYEHSWVAVIQPDRSFEVSRMD